MLSVIYITYRPGGIDLLGGSLANQQDAPPWELIVVDDFPGRAERGLAAAYLRGLDLPLAYYGPSKPKTRPETKLGLANATNTSILHARGSHFLLLHDYMLYPPNALATWWRKFQEPPEKKLVSGWAKVYRGPPPAAPNDVISYNQEMSLEFRDDWIPEIFEGFYYGGPIAFFEEINGLDERTDHCTVWTLHVMLAQAGHFGWTLKVDPDLLCRMVDHRAWDETNPLTDPEDSLWRIKHHSSAPKEPTWTPRSLNAYNFAAMRRMVLGT